jgi:hypothetical protein
MPAPTCEGAFSAERWVGPSAATPMTARRFGAVFHHAACTISKAPAGSAMGPASYRWAHLHQQHRGWGVTTAALTWACSRHPPVRRGAANGDVGGQQGTASSTSAQQHAPTTGRCRLLGVRAGAVANRGLNSSHLQWLCRMTRPQSGNRCCQGSLWLGYARQLAGHVAVVCTIVRTKFPQHGTRR